MTDEIQTLRVRNGFHRYFPTAEDYERHGKIKRVYDFEYHDVLGMVCHEQENFYTRNRWQLTRPLSISFTVQFADGYIRRYFAECPIGMYTDLASSPKAVWWVIGPIGRHLYASIPHDFYFMAWTDRPGGKVDRRDFRFANMVYKAGLIKSGVPGWARALILAGVSGPIGWKIFKSKDYTLSERLKAWEKDLPK